MSHTNDTETHTKYRATTKWMALKTVFFLLFICFCFIFIWMHRGEVLCLCLHSIYDVFFYLASLCLSLWVCVLSSASQGISCNFFFVFNLHLLLKYFSFISKIYSALLLINVALAHTHFSRSSYNNNNAQQLRTTSHSKIQKKNY